MKRLYSVPRQFDLATIFVVSVASAVLFACMRQFKFSDLVFAAVCGMFAVVGIAQALMFKGQSPRAASVIAGAVYVELLMVIADVAMRRPFEMIVEGSVPAVIGGAVCGYVVGILVGGVFLIADIVRGIAEYVRSKVRKP